MTFTTEYEIVLRAIAFAIAIAAWVFARSAMGQPVLHPWLGALGSGLLAILGACIVVIPGTGPVPDILTVSGALLTGMLFSAGVRLEAGNPPLKRPAFIALIVAALVGGAIINALVRDMSLQILVVRFCVAACLAVSLLWLPSFLRSPNRRLSVGAIAVFVIVVVIDRTLPLLQHFARDAKPWSVILPYVEGSDLLIILAGGAAMIVVSADHHRRQTNPSRP